MDDNIAIKAEGVSKDFRLPHEKNSSIKSAVINFYKRNRTFEKQEALKNVSFEVKKGEFFGIVGRNGSGKSTLLKMLAGIYSPSQGNITVNGKLTPFIELGVGFNMELTGRENVFLNGALLGFNRKEMNSMYKSIVEFAELERFMDQKLKNYSSGMQVRLAFSIAIRAKSDILLIDEVLAVGDAAFQQKCYEVFADLKKAGKTIILVTHDMSAVFRFCDHALLINDSKVLDEGNPKEIADKYLELNYQEESANNLVGKEKKADTPIKFAAIKLDGKTDKASFTTNHKGVLVLSFANPAKKPLHFGVQVFNEAGNYCFGTNTKINDIEPTALSKGSISIDITFSLAPGNYTLTAAIMNEDANRVISYKPNAVSFRVSKTTEIEGIANLPHKWDQAHV